MGVWSILLPEVHNIGRMVFTPEATSRKIWTTIQFDEDDKKMTSFCNIWWHHFATFDDIILQHLHLFVWLAHLGFWIHKGKKIYLWKTITVEMTISLPGKISKLRNRQTPEPGCELCSPLVMKRRHWLVDSASYCLVRETVTHQCCRSRSCFWIMDHIVSCRILTLWKNWVKNLIRPGNDQF